MTLGGSESICCCCYCCKAPCGRNQNTGKEEKDQVQGCPYEGVCYGCTPMKCCCYPAKMTICPGSTGPVISEIEPLVMYHLWCMMFLSPSNYHPCASARFGWKCASCMSGGCLDPDLECNCSTNCNPCDDEGSLCGTGCNKSVCTKQCEEQKEAASKIGKGDDDGGPDDPKKSKGPGGDPKRDDKSVTSEARPERVSKKNDEEAAA